jgi:protocatechuate 3,4-dioxygenase beta subunit
VDEELQRLPDALRSAVVLCHLEGNTHEEAARQLGWSKGTLRRRLDRGRELLRRRLLARGLAPAAALTATQFAEGGASAAVPAKLVETTVLAALNADAVSPAIAALAEAGLGVLCGSKTRLAIVLLLAMSLMTGVGLWMGLGLAAPPPATETAKPISRPPQADPKANDDVLAVRCRVLDPDNKPVAGARLYLPRRSRQRPEEREDIPVVQRGTTDAEGRFRLELPRKEVQSDRPVPLLATADGFGLAWVELPKKEGPGDLTLRLVKDVPIRGRIVTTEGKPMAGIAVSVAGVMAFERLDDFLRVFQRETSHFDEGTGARRLNVPLNDVLRVKVTDNDGRFVIHGVGVERLTGLEVKYGAVAPAAILVVTRTDFDAKSYARSAVRRDGYRTPPLFGPSFEHVVARAVTRPTIEGVVREAGNGKPVVGATVMAGGSSTVTDAEGHYRLVGMRMGPEGYVLFVTAPTDRPLIGHWVRITATPDREPMRVNVELTRGVVVTGRVYDKATGKGVRDCSVHFSPLPDNKTGKTEGLALYASTSEDGRYRLVAILGPGVLLAGVPGTLFKIEGVPIYPYKLAEFDAADRPRIKMTDALKPRRAFVTASGPEELDFSNACKVVDVKDDGTPISCDLALDPGKTLTVNLEDAEGKPLAGSVAAGVSAQIIRTVPIRGATCRIYALDPANPRQVAFLHAERKLAALVTLRGDEQEPLTVRLAPTSVLTGRVLDVDGQPVADAEVYTRYGTAVGQQFTKSQGRFLLPQTDKEGRFRLEGVVPGLPMELGFLKGRQMRVPQTRLEIKPLESGRTLDLGDIRTKPRE